MDHAFTFLDPGPLIDGDLELVLVKKNPANEEKQFVPEYKFEMRNTHTGERMGYIDLRIGDSENTIYGGHIGYGVDEPFRGNKYAARGCKLLFPLAEKHGMNSLLITCNPDNYPSRRTCELAGGKLVEVVDLPEWNDMYQRGERQKCRYRFEL